MATLRISLQALREVDRAMNEYRELLENLVQSGVLQENTRKTYELHSENFVRWLRDEFEPGGRKIR